MLAMPPHRGGSRCCLHSLVSTSHPHNSFAFEVMPLLTADPEGNMARFIDSHHLPRIYHTSFEVFRGVPETQLVSDAHPVGLRTRAGPEASVVHVHSATLLSR